MDIAVKVGGQEVSSDPSGLAVRQVRRGPDAWVLAVSGELSPRSAGLVSGAVAKALADSGRVLVDVSGLRVTWPPTVQVFPSVLVALGGWPGARLVLFGADAGLAGSLAALRVSATVPVAPDEVTARRLLDQRPRVVARRLDLEQPRSSARRARAFVRAACADWRLDEIRDDATVVASELVANAVLHAGTACRLTVRYNAFGLTVEVRDYRPDRLPEPPPVDPEPPQCLSGLFIVDALTREWGIMPRMHDKTVWALLPVGDSPTYSRAIRKAVHDAVRAVLPHGRNTTAAATALRQITARLTEQHGAAAARDLTDELARELAAANSAVAWINNGDGNEGDEHNGRDTRSDGIDTGSDGIDTGFDDQHRPNPSEPGTP